MTSKLSTLTIYQKITGVLIVYFIVALVAIASTLLVSWHLEGGAAAINDAGSERMRSYRIAFLLGQHIKNPSAQLATQIAETITSFEHTLLVLEKGDPSRPLMLPDDLHIRQKLKQIQHVWVLQNKVYVYAILKQTDKAQAERLLKKYANKLPMFVANVDKLVKLIEQRQAQATRLLRGFQIGLVSLALVGTLLLIYMFMHMIIMPIRTLHQGLMQMGEGDFMVRLPVTSGDELGALALGFNRMAEQLQQLYSSLEQRINDKTKSIELKSRELGALYDTTAFLNTAAATKTLCDGVLGKMVVLFGAHAGVIRLVGPKNQGIPIVAGYGVSADFLQEENNVQCGECLCGDTAMSAQSKSSLVVNIQKSPTSRQDCMREGFQGVVSVPIMARNRVIGVFNLFFRTPSLMPSSEVKLLETVGQHLGVAIENQRLIEREKEMAVSEERNLLAQELHDSIAQSLAFLNIQAQLLQDSLQKGQLTKVDEILAKISEGIQESYGDVRELLVHFRTRIEHDDIDVAIRTALQKFENQTNIKTHYQYQGAALTIAPETVLQLLHILHESLSNIRKHSQATLVEVKLFSGKECRLLIHDNGVGFDGNTIGIDETHVGLRIMKERSLRIKGKLTINAIPCGGTQISLILPLSNVATAGA